MSEGIKKDILLEDAILGFINSLEGNKQFSKSTIKKLGSEAQVFLRYSNSKNKKKSSLFLSQTIYPRFVKEYLSKYNNQRTITNKVSFLKHFFGYLMSKKYIDNFDIIKAFKEKQIVSQESPKVLTNEQLLELIQLSKNGPNGVRNQCLILLLATTGLRINEISHLRLWDIDFNDKSLQINFRGSEFRKTPVSSFTIESIKEYIKVSFQLTEVEIKEETNRKRYLFPSKTEGEPISTGNINYIIRELIENSQTIPIYDKRGYDARSFKHSFIYLAYQNGMSLENLSIIKRITPYETLKYINNLELENSNVE